VGYHTPTLSDCQLDNLLDPGWGWGENLPASKSIFDILTRGGSIYHRYPYIPVSYRRYRHFRYRCFDIWISYCWQV